MVPEVIPSRQDPEEGERVNGHGHGPSDRRRRVAGVGECIGRGGRGAPPLALA